MNKKRRFQMYCSKCGYDNLEDEKICKACSAPLPIIPDLPPEVKTSKLAIWSFVLSMMGLFSFMVTGLPAIICGIIGLIKISGSKGRLKGLGFSITGIIVPVVYLFLILPILLAILMPALGKVRQVAQRIVCSTNCSAVSNAVFAYASDHNDTLPGAEKWSNVLIDDYNVTMEQFSCPAVDVKEEKSCFALNVNIAGRNLKELTPDVVLIFECVPGDNPAGGQELLTTERHQNDGCNIVFADGHVKFVSTYELPNLKWKLE
jgi:prepilin-type processing-associated H-X9-DG protein